MTQETPRKDKLAFFHSDWGPIISAILTAVVSFLIWMANSQRQVDVRLDQLETTMNHITDREGELRPSPEARRAMFSVEALKDDIRLLRERQNFLESARIRDNSK